MARIVVLAFDDPWASHHGGTLRTRAFVDALAELGHDAVCVFAGATPDSPTNRDAARVGVSGKPAGETVGVGRVGRIKRHYLPMPTVRGGWIPDLAEAVGQQAPADLLLVQQLRGVPYLRMLPGARLWFDQTDLWSEFLVGEIATRRGMSRGTARCQQLHLRRLERRAARSAAMVSAAGFGDTQRLSEAQSQPAVWLPTPVSQFSGVVPRDLQGEARPTAGLLANFAYWPNRDAYDVLRESWAPALVRQGWRVVAAGYGSSELPRSPEIELLGTVDSVAHFYGGLDLALSPIRLGGGIKVKVLEALFAGRPVAASHQSLDGFPPGAVEGAVPTDVTTPVFPAAERLTAPKTGLVSDAVLRLLSPHGFREVVSRALV